MRNYITVIITILAAMMLALLPMPEWTAWLRPAWVLLVLIFWTMSMPFHVNVGFAWMAGIMLDVLTGTILGEHALALTVVIYLSYRLHMRINMSPMLQQGVSILFFVFIYQLIIYCVQGVIGQLPQSHMYWLSSLTSMLLWPWLYILLRDCCVRFRVALAE